MKRTIKTGYLQSTLLIICIGGLLSFDIPTGWHKTGKDPDKYYMGVDSGAGTNGSNVATIRSLTKQLYTFGTLMQSCKPDKYLGKRVRMTGMMKSDNVARWAGFWFRVDQAGSDERLSFDNMQNRAITGTTGWRKYEIVLDVPMNASNIAYGALLGGTGQIWFDDIQIDIVDNTIPVTDLLVRPKEPQNLNFEE